MPNERPIQADDPLTAGWANRVEADLRAARVVSDGSLLVDRTPGGQLVRLADASGGAGVAEVACFRLDSHTSGGWYGGVMQRAITAGGWEDIPGSPTIPASDHRIFEREGFAALLAGGATNIYVRAERDRRTGVWIFQRGNC